MDVETRQSVVDWCATYLRWPMGSYEILTASEMRLQLMSMMQRSTLGQNSDFRDFVIEVKEHNVEKTTTL